MIKIITSILWVSGSELLEYSYTPVRHMAQSINNFGCQKKCFYQSDLPSYSLPVGCLYAGIISSKETKNWKMQWFFPGAIEQALPIIRKKKREKPL